MVKVISAVALAALLPYVTALFIPEYIRDHTKAFEHSDYEAPIHSADNAKVIEDHYIVVFHPHAEDHNIAQHHNFLLTALLGQPPIQGKSSQQTLGWRNPLNNLFGMVKHTYNITNQLKGYSGSFSKSAIDLVRKDPMVAWVEPDQIVTTYEQEKNAPWGLARISHRQTLSFGTFNKYDYDARGGEGITGITSYH